MLIIHQRKSAGTSLVHTLSKVLATDIEDSVKVTVMNTRGKALFDFLSCYLSPKSRIKSVHLHPTRANMNWVKDNQVKCVILLRNPADSFRALKRHREVDNVFLESNSAIYYKDSAAILEEFYFNWLCLKDEPNVLIVFFEDLVLDPSFEIKRILSFYDYDPNLYEINFEKKRYSGEGVKEIGGIKVSQSIPCSGPTFVFEPDYKSFLPRTIWRVKVFIKRKVNRIFG